MQVDELWLGVSGESDDEIEMSEFLSLIHI